MIQKRWLFHFQSAGNPHLLQANDLDMEHVPLQIRLNDLELKTQRTTDLSPSLVSTTWCLLPTCLPWFRCRSSKVWTLGGRVPAVLCDRGRLVCPGPNATLGDAGRSRAQNMGPIPKCQIRDDLGWVDAAELMNASLFHLAITVMTKSSPWFFDGPNRNRCFTY